MAYAKDRVLGIDGRRDSALTNWTWNAALGAFDNRIGYEKFFARTTDSSPFTGIGPVWAVASVTDGALEWWLLHANNSIYLLADWTDSPALIALSTSWPDPGGLEPGARFVPLGSRRVLVVGPGGAGLIDLQPPVDPSNPASIMREFGWRAPPPAPDPWPVSTSPSSPASRAAGEVSLWMDSTDYGGLGSDTASATNRYRYRVSFLSDTGSESPASSPSRPVEWITPSSGSWANMRFGVRVDIPKGPPGTIGRRIYRTQNLGKAAWDGVYYHVADVPNNSDDVFFDYVNDGALTDELDATRTPLPSRPRAAAEFGGCVFIDDGPTSLYFSRPGAPEEFDTTSFIRLSPEGGLILGLLDAKTYLLVLRERGLDAIIGTYSSGFRALPLVRGEAIVPAATYVPGHGVVVLSRRAVFRVPGGLVAGDRVERAGLDSAVGRALERMTDGTRRAAAAYSPRWREAHFYFPADGSDRDMIGLVLHLDTGGWSVREGFPVGCLAVSRSGDLVFGHAAGQYGSEEGLYVITRRRALGWRNTGQGWTDGPAPTSTFWSPWIRLEDPEAFAVHRVYLDIRTTGSNKVTLRYAVDGDVDSYTEVHAAQVMYSEGSAQPTLDAAVIDTDSWTEARLVRLRYDIGGVRCSAFRFGFETSSDAVLAAWHVEIEDTGGRRVLRGRA